jgi:hypothetical protein
MAKSTDERLDDLIRLMERNSGRSTSSSSSEKSSPVDLGTDNLKTKILDTAEVFKNVKQSVSETQDMYHSLSKAGMSFRGDLFAMGNAAVGMRMSTKELEESFLSFQKDGILKGFGTNLTDSAEKMAMASKHFFDNNTVAADGLRRMGYTTKDINEVMALQGVTLRGKFKDDQEMASVAAENAGKLGLEMDALSKLTGKSRQDQVEMMKKQQADMQFEAAIRLKTQGMSAEDAAKFEANARQELKNATLLGQGQMFKEVFATGQIMTKEAATQAAINREQATAATNMAKTAADRTLTAAQREEKGIEARNQLAAAATADLNNTVKLQAATLGDAGGNYSKVILDNMGKQIDFGRTIEKVAAANGLNLKSEEDKKKATEMAMEEIRKAQAGERKDKEGEYQRVDASSRALTSFQGRLGDAASVMNEKFTQPIQGQVNKALGALAEGAFKATGNLGGIINDRAKGTTVSQKLASEIDTGAEKGFKDSHGVIQSLGAANKAAHDTVNETIPKMVEGAKDLAKTVKEKAQTRTEPAGRRDQGSLGMTGQIFENFGSGTLMELHGMESVMRPKDLMELSKNQMEGMMKAIPKSGVLDLDKMKKDAISFSASNKESDKAKKDAAPSSTSNTSIDGTKEIDRKSLKFDQFGMPITSGIKYKANEMSAEVQKKEEEKKAASSNVEDMKKGIAAGKPAAPEEKKPEATKPAPSTSKESSLSDVVASLNQLNSKVSQLIDVQKDIGQRQIKAVKSNSKDVYNQ